MNFGFDIDGTITTAPVEYARLMRALMRDNNQVHVITTLMPDSGHQTEQSRVKQLEEMGIYRNSHYSALYQAKGSTRLEVGKAKAAYCKAEHIKWMMDDDPIYIKQLEGVTYVAQPEGNPPHL